MKGLWVALSTLLLGLVLLASGTTIAIVRFVRSVSTSAIAVPAAIDRHLGTGTWDVYAGDVSVNVLVLAPDGAQIPVEPSDASSTITQNTHEYVSAWQFAIDQAGVYDIRITADEPTEVLLARPLSKAFLGLVAPIGGAVVGGLLFFAGIVLLIVRVMTRNKGPSAGWYPDPSGGTGRRYWDGKTWTEHSSA